MTGEERYQRACRRAHLRGRRNLKKFMAGEIAILPTSHPAADIIREIDDAYKSGVKAGKAMALDNTSAR